MYKFSAYVFWTTLTLYVLTLFAVSYVGVCLTYVAVPVIVLAGLGMKCGRRPAAPGAVENSVKAVGNGLLAAGGAFEQFAADAEQASVAFLAKSRADRAAQLSSDAYVPDPARALRAAKLKRYQLTVDREAGTLAPDANLAALAKLEREIANLEKELDGGAEAR